MGGKKGKELFCLADSYTAVSYIQVFDLGANDIFNGQTS